MAKKRAKKSRKTPKSKKVSNSGNKKVHLVLKNLILFLAISIISFILRSILAEGLFKSFFFLLSIIFAFVAVAFLIVLLVLLALKFVKKKWLC